MDPFSVESNDDTDQYDTPDDEDGDILCGGMQSLGIEYNYVSDWKPPHAIREYHQNWYVAAHYFQPQPSVKDLMFDTVPQ